MAGDRIDQTRIKFAQHVSDPSPRSVRREVRITLLIGLSILACLLAMAIKLLG